MIKVFYGMSALAASMVTLLMGSFVFSRDPKNITYRLFLLINFAVSIWCFSSFVFSITDNIRIAFLWNNISYFAGAFIPAFFLHFIFSLTGAHKDRILFVVYVMAAGLGLANFSPLFVEEMISRLPYYNFLPIPNYLYHLFVGFFMLTLIFAYYSLVQAYRQVKGEQKNHLLYLIIGSAIGFLGTIDFFLVVYDMQPRLPFPHDILIIAYTLIFAYAILRFRLMDIEIVIKRGVVYSTLTAILTGIFISIVLVWEKIFIGITGYGSIWIGIIVAFVIAVIFQPLRDSVQEIVDTYFFHVRYDYQRILRRYSHALAQPMVDLNRFSRLAPYLLTKSMKLAGSAVTVLDRDTQTYILRAGERNAQDLEGTVLGNDSSLMTEIKGTLNEVSLEEIENRLRDEDLSKAERMKLHKIATEMKNLKTVLVIPCVSESHYFKIPTLISTLNLGKKLSEENFSREDIQFLKTLANQATISIEYAFIFEELKRHQERVLRSEKLAAIGTTTAGVAHELKNPLTYLSAVSQVLHRKWDDPEFKKSVSEMLPSEVQRMQLIVEGLLDYSRTRELMLKPLDIKTVIEKTIALLAYDIKKNKIYVKTDYHHVRKALGDPNRLMQVFMNLIANAVQAMGEKGGDLSVVTSCAENEIRIAISDTGPGIPEEKQQKIYDPFFSTKETGTGLGLPISKKIIEEHKGSIYVHSTPGQGTTFTVCLPAVVST